MGGRTVSGVNLDRADRLFDWSSVQVVIAGLGMSGFAAADALLDLDASVLVLDDRDDDDHRDKANLLEVLGASVRLGAGSTAQLPPGTAGMASDPTAHRPGPGRRCAGVG